MHNDSSLDKGEVFFLYLMVFHIKRRDIIFFYISLINAILEVTCTTRVL